MKTYQVVQLVDSGYRLPPPPGCPRVVYELMMCCWSVLSKLFKPYKNKNKKLNFCIGTLRHLVDWDSTMCCGLSCRRRRLCWLFLSPLAPRRGHWVQTWWQHITCTLTCRKCTILGVLDVKCGCGNKTTLWIWLTCSVSQFYACVRYKIIFCCHAWAYIRIVTSRIYVQVYAFCVVLHQCKCGSLYLCDSVLTIRQERIDRKSVV